MSYTYNFDQQSLWEILKYETRKSSIYYSKVIAKEKQKKSIRVRVYTLQ